MPDAMTPRAIRLLPSATADRIAAGEVVERPAAAVKELVENALDAGALQVVVTLEEGGLARICVEDDGVGMSPADLALCVERHATSKLPEEAMLFRIATLGFRGEALPSIGAVARLTITSRQAGGEAHAISVEAGRKGELRPASGARGTRVEVRDLFFATPARRKFLRGAQAEATRCLETLRRLALAWPEVAFRATLDGRDALALPAQPREARIAALLGAAFAEAAVPVDGVSGALHLSGLAALPTHARATAEAQHLVVNRRPVRDPMLRAALRGAYRDVMEAGRHPAAALFLELPPEEVDVNVHPMKTELRFREAERVRGLIVGSVRRAIAVGAGIAVTEPSRPFAFAVRGLAEAQAPFAQPPLALSPGRLAPLPEAPRATQDEPLGRALAQIAETYILAEAPDGALVLVDQHAAHERLTQERLAAELAEGSIRAQPLLLPAIVDLPPSAAARVVAEAEALARLGLEVEAFGPGAVLVRALPALLGTAEPGPLLRDLAEELLAEEEPGALLRRLDAAIARLACHGSVRAGRCLAAAEMDALLRAMEATPRAATCSHGRPTFLRLDTQALARLFGRR
jgi:DNA mismatch repair protein MutL